MQTPETETRRYPAIIVESPHQFPCEVWVARSEEDITDHLHNGTHGDNWGWAEHPNIDEWAKEVGFENLHDMIAAGEELPEGVTNDFPRDVPIVETRGGGWHTIGERESEPTEYDHAIDYLGHDLHGLAVLESREDAEVLLNRAARAHNIHAGKLREAMKELGWSA